MRDPIFLLPHVSRQKKLYTISTNKLELLNYRIDPFVVAKQRQNEAITLCLKSIFFYHPFLHPF